jgi:anaerobic selenocysteine-containing dehydrogenase
MKIKRRDFLKLSVAAGAAATVGKPVLNAFAEEAKKQVAIGELPGEWKATTCQGCTTWCPAEVFVQDGRAVKVRGNRYSKQNDGTVCLRSHLGLQQVYDPDRIKVPMKRTNPKKGRGEDPQFVPISWDEALNAVADKMMELRNNDESEKYCLMRGRYTYLRDVLYEIMTKVYGSPNSISHSSMCAEAEKFGAYYTEGYWGYRDYDLDNAKYVLVWGCDPVASNRMVPAAIKRFGDAIERGTVAAVDPRLTTTAAKAHEWLPVDPGTDAAAALAIAHVLLTEGTWYKDFVGDFKDGKNRFKTGKTVNEADFNEKESYGVVKWWNLAVKDMTPKKAAKLCNVDADQIIRIARGMAKAAPNVCVWMGPGAGMHARGAYNSMAVHALAGLTGGVDSEGGSMQTAKIPVNKVPKAYKKFKDEVAKKKTKLKKIDQRGYLNLPTITKGKPGGGVSTNNVATGILAKDPMEIKMIVGYMNNFNFSNNGTKKWEKALESVPFITHLTTHVSEFSMYADILIPCRMNQFERWGFVKTKANRYATCTLNQAVIEPVFHALNDETEFPFLIGEKLKERGFPNLLDCLQAVYPDPETGRKPKTPAELTEFALKYYTQKMWDGKKDVGGDKINGWEEFKKRGMWNSDPYKYRKHWGGKFGKTSTDKKTGKEKTTGTITHKFEFYSETLKKALGKHAKNHNVSIDKVMEACNYLARGEQVFVPHFEEPLRHGSRKEYPFVFIDYKSRLNREGRSANNPWYYEFKHVDPGDVGYQDTLRINPADGKKLKLKDGDKVKISSVEDSGICTIRLWEGVKPGTVSKSFGQGHWAYGRTAAAKFGKEERGANNNTIIPWELERLSGSNARNGGHALVKIEKV